MGLVAKKMQEKRRKSRFFNFKGKVSWEENEEHDLPGRTHVLSSSCSSEKMKKKRRKK